MKMARGGTRNYKQVVGKLKRSSSISLANKERNFKIVTLQQIVRLSIFKQGNSTRIVIAIVIETLLNQ